MVSHIHYRIQDTVDKIKDFNTKMKQRLLEYEQDRQEKEITIQALGKTIFQINEAQTNLLKIALPRFKETAEKGLKEISDFEKSLEECLSLSLNTSDISLPVSNLKVPEDLEEIRNNDQASDHPFEQILDMTPFTEHKNNQQVEKFPKELEIEEVPLKFEVSPKENEVKLFFFNSF